MKILAMLISLAALAGPLRASEFEDGLTRVQGAVSRQARAVKSALRSSDYSNEIALPDGKRYLLELSVTAEKAPRAKLHSESFNAGDEDTGRTWLDCSATLKFEKVATILATLTDERTGAQDTWIEPVTFELDARRTQPSGTICPAWNLSGPISQWTSPSEADLNIPDMKTGGLEILLLPFSTGLYTAQNLDAALKRSGDSYILAGFDFEKLRGKAVDEKGAPRYQLGWRTDPYAGVTYIPLSPKVQAPATESYQDPYGLNTDPHECDEW